MVSEADHGSLDVIEAVLKDLHDRAFAHGPSSWNVITRVPPDCTRVLEATSAESMAGCNYEHPEIQRLLRRDV